MSWRMRPKLPEPEPWRGHQDPEPDGHCMSPTCWSPFTWWMMPHDPIKIEACIQHCWPQPWTMIEPKNFLHLARSREYCPLYTNCFQSLSPACILFLCLRVT